MRVSLRSLEIEALLAGVTHPLRKSTAEKMLEKVEFGVKREWHGHVIYIDCPITLASSARKFDKREMAILKPKNLLFAYAKLKEMLYDDVLNYIIADAIGELSDEEIRFRAEIGRNPKDANCRLVFADWLEEQGRTPEGALQREFASKDGDRCTTNPSPATA